VEPSPAPRELIVVAEPHVGLRASAAGLMSASGASLDSLSALLATENIQLEPLFGLSEELVDRRFLLSAAECDTSLSAPSLFYKVSGSNSDLERLAERLREHESVHAAYIKPGVELPFMDSGEASIPVPPPAVTRDLTGDQIYLGPAPHGVDAKASWSFPGGGGAGIRIIDIEGAWRFTHEDLTENQGGVAGGTETDDLFWRSHGTAVLGVLSGDRNQGENFGIIGICPEANVRGVSVYGQPISHVPFDSGTAAAIRQAADLLRKGDIMVIEMHSPGPPDFEVRQDQQDYTPIEWWPDNFAAIQYAVCKGVIVVAAAGNGGRNLCDDIFEHIPASPYGPFPANWKNPFRRTNTDSGSILVGAGTPPILNGIDLGRELSRMPNSNFGCNVDAQGWGGAVVTSGFGNLQQGDDEDRWYTPNFGGTSAATPMVAGALACVQGALLSAGKPLLTPLEARELLAKTGSPQVDGDPGTNRPLTQHIGNRPDIKEMLKVKGVSLP
jgi:subtilisin family serine protease